MNVIHGVINNLNQSDIYLREALTQAEFALQSFNAHKRALKSREIPEVFQFIHHFIVHVANIDKILNPQIDNPRNEILAGRVDMSDIDLKLFRRLRNHLEHFDERLDAWVKNHTGRVFLDMNIITGCTGYPNKVYLRALDGEIFKFYGEEYPLNKLHSSIELLHTRLTAEMNGY